MKQTIADLIISGLLKRGVVWETKNLDVEIFVPVMVENEEKQMKVIIKASEGMSIKVERE